MPKISVFFGAGAEVSYGMPTGGQFALDILRRNANAERERFKELRDAVDSRSTYASDWLPKNYAQKRINVFGAAEKAGIFRSSLEYNKHKIVSMLENFDTNSENALRRLSKTKSDIDAVYENDCKFQIGNRIYAHDVEINSKLSNSKKLFESEFFSAALETLRQNPENAELEKYVRSVIQIYIGSLGQTLAVSLNQEVFSRAPDDLSVFDDITGIFEIEVGQAGLSAYELIMDKPLKEIRTDTATHAFSDILHGVLEDIMSFCLDYQSLIDDNFRYLFRPQAEWAKFCKISVFLLSARAYVKETYANILSGVSSSSGYYDDLAERVRNAALEVQGVATANYTDLATTVIGRYGVVKEVKHLNGHVDLYYDPYKNTMLSMSEDQILNNRRFVVPFIFTQSGIKPLTSVDMSRKYVDFYDEMKESDAVIVVGYGFNGDDGHINGMFRKIAEDDDTPVYVTSYCQDPATVDLATEKRKLMRRMRCENGDSVHVLPVGSDRKTGSGNLWIDDVLADLP